FEEEWRRRTGVREVLAVSNGTTALECCLRGMGVRELSERESRMLGELPRVIVPARTFVATASSVVTCGGQPVIADIDPATLCVSAETLEAAWQEHGPAVGVIVVHYAG